MIDVHPENPWSWAFVIHKPHPFVAHCFLGSDGSVWSDVIWSHRSRRHVLANGFRELPIKLDPCGYPFAAVGIAPARCSFRVHRLVLETFVGVRPEGMECRHLNGVRHDNRLCNLKWGTKAENGEDARRHGNQKRAQRASGFRFKRSSVLSPHDIVEIRQLRADGLKFVEIAKRFPVGPEHLGRIASGKSWRHLP